MPTRPQQHAHHQGARHTQHSRGTRDAAKSGLATLAKLLDTTVGELLMPLRDSHLKPLLARRLRALALPAQVAITEAVCFVLKESPRGEGVTETLPLEPPLIALLGEALLSAEGEDAGREKPRLLGLTLTSQPPIF